MVLPGLYLLGPQVVNKNTREENSSLLIIGLLIRSQHLGSEISYQCSESPIIFVFYFGPFFHFVFGFTRDYIKSNIP